MKKNGFITSALLYGILALFLILMLGSLAVLANRKMSMDALKEAALEDVGSTSETTSSTTSYYNIWQDGISYQWDGYASDAGYDGTWQTTSANPSLIFSTDSYQNISGVYLSLSEAVTSDMTVTVFYSNSTTFTDDQSVTETILSGSSTVSFTFISGDYKYIKLEIGNASGLSYKINEVNLIIQND